MDETKVDEMLLKIARAIDKEYGCVGCPYEYKCLARADEECIGKIMIWLKSVIE